MTDNFIELFDELLITKEPRSQKQAEQLRDEVWEELKFHKPIIKQIFAEVKRTWPHNTMPALSVFVKARNEIRFADKTSIEDSHYPKNKSCNCDVCKIKKRLDQDLCMYCAKKNDFVIDAYECSDCHFKRIGNQCECEYCISECERLLEEMNEFEEIQEDLTL